MNKQEEERINEGDVVDVYFNDNTDCERGLVVLYIPCATGDCWRLKRRGGRREIVYIQSFTKMVKCPA